MRSYLYHGRALESVLRPSAKALSKMPTLCYTSECCIMCFALYGDVQHTLVNLYITVVLELCSTLQWNGTPQDAPVLS